MEFARSRIAAGATVVADETPHWDLLGNTFDLERVNHSDAYSFLGGVHVNGTESYFARLRSMEASIIASAQAGLATTLLTRVGSRIIAARAMGRLSPD